MDLITDMSLQRNLRKAIDLTSYSIYADGAFSSYYLYDTNMGIKTFYSDGHATIKSLIKSRVWSRATKEHKLLKKCRERYKNIPEAYGVFPIKVGKKYYPGIVMQHIEGKTLSSYSYEEETNLRILGNLKRGLKKVGIVHEDLHRANVIWSNIDLCYYVIDFTHDLIILENGYNNE